MMVALGPGWSGSIFHLHSAFGTASRGVSAARNWTDLLPGDERRRLGTLGALRWDSLNL